MSRNEGVSVLTLPKIPPLSSCVRSLSLLRRRAIPRICCIHCWKLHPSSAQPPIHLKPLAPHHGDTVAPEHSAWFELLQPNGGWHPLVLRKGKKTPLVILAPPKTTWHVRRAEVHTALYLTVLPHSPGAWAAFPHRDSSNFMLCMSVSANWSPKTGCAVSKGQEKITPGAFIPEALVGALF